MKAAHSLQHQAIKTMTRGTDHFCLAKDLGDETGEVQCGEVKHGEWMIMGWHEVRARTRQSSFTEITKAWGGRLPSKRSVRWSLAEV